MLLTPGQTHEMRVAEELLRDVHNAYVIGDSAYSAKSLVDSLLARGCTVVTWLLESGSGNPFEDTP